MEQLQHTHTECLHIRGLVVGNVAQQYDHESSLWIPFLFCLGFIEVIVGKDMQTMLTGDLGAYSWTLLVCLIHVLTYPGT